MPNFCSSFEPLGSPGLKEHFHITGLLLQEFERTGKIMLSGFWARRFLRLMPSFLLLILLASLFCFLDEVLSEHTEEGRLLVPHELFLFRTDAIASLFYAQNLHLMRRGTGYFDEAVHPSPFLHLWSLSLEEQFYAFFPLLLFGLLAAFRRPSGALGATLGYALPAAVLALAVQSALWQLLTDPADPAVYYSPLCRFYEPLLGSLAAILAPCFSGVVLPTTVAGAGAEAGGWHRRTGLYALYALLAGFFGLGLFFFMAMPVVTGEDADSGGTPIWYGHGGGLMAAAAATALLASTSCHALADTRAQGWAAAALSWAPLVHVGRTSYDLYLVHWTFFVYIGTATATSTAVALVLAFAAAEALFRLHRAVTAALRALTAPAHPLHAALFGICVAGAVLCLICVVTVTSGAKEGGIDWDAGSGMSPADLQMLGAMHRIEERLGLQPLSEAEGPAPGAKVAAAVLTMPVKIMVLGDSFALYFNKYVPELNEELAVRGSSFSFELCFAGSSGAPSMLYYDPAFGENSTAKMGKVQQRVLAGMKKCFAECSLAVYHERYDFGIETPLKKGDPRPQWVRKYPDETAIAERFFGDVKEAMLRNNPAAAADPTLPVTFLINDPPKGEGFHKYWNQQSNRAPPYDNNMAMAQFAGSHRHLVTYFDLVSIVCPTYSPEEKAISCPNDLYGYEAFRRDSNHVFGDSALFAYSRLLYMIAEAYGIPTHGILHPSPKDIALGRDPIIPDTNKLKKDYIFPQFFE